MTANTNNIFLTWENLAFAMPLISVCVVYAYFKYIPLKIGVPLLGLVGFAYFIQLTIQAQRNKKLQHLDEGMVRELAGEEDADTAVAAAAKAKEAQKKKKKAQEKVQQRLAAERKKETIAAASKKKKKSNKNNTDDDDAEDDDIDEAMLTFVKGSRDKKNK